MEDLKVESSERVEEQGPNSNNKDNSEEVNEPEMCSTGDEKHCDSDANSDDLSSNDEQNNVNSNNSQFYEGSDSKLDYAVKLDDSDTLSDIEDIKTDTASADSEDSALGSLPPDSTPNEREEDAQDRSDGSDSGIGSETNEDSKLPSFNLAIPCLSNSVNNPSCSKEQKNESLNEINKDNNQDDIEKGPSSPQIRKPIKSSLKRKHEDESAEEPEVKRKKESIKFDNVTVYYFPRAQGFSCVPSQGGSTLGMEWQHTHSENFTLAEHALEQRRLHRQILQQLKSERHSIQGASLSSSEDSDSEEEASDISESELDLDSYYFLQPIPTRQRRALLRGAGVRKIEAYEKDECKDIRTSREFCGCACKGVCNPDNCSCSLGGIKCQVDRLNFPCGCTRDGCGNTTGRIEFNPVRVRTHFIHTLMRIGLEKKNEENQAAAKKQWNEAHGNTSSCIANTSYERERCMSHEDGMLRDVNLTPRVEVESCVNSGSFNNVHCNMNNIAPRGNMQEDITYGYTKDNLKHSNHNNETYVMRFDNSNNHHGHADPYTSSILQGKGPPYSNTMGFNNISNNMQRYSCDMNYSYDQHTDNSHHFKGLQSFSASSFEEFAHNSHMSMFSHYGHMYVPDYMHKTNTSGATEHNTLQQYHTMPQNHYESYKDPSECANTESKDDSQSAQYTTLMTLPYQNSNKLQTLQNDENWFSHNGLLNMDQSVAAPPEVASAPLAPAAAATEAAATEPTENFGELIKKTMVESVTV